MNRSKREFEIAHVIRDNETLSVDGRCLEGPLRLGDVFTRLYRLERAGERTEFGSNLVVSDFREVNIRIDSILYVDRYVDLLSSGHTARLTISGIGGELIKTNAYDVLGD